LVRRVHALGDEAFEIVLVDERGELSTVADRVRNAPKRTFRARDHAFEQVLPFAERQRAHVDGTDGEDIEHVEGYRRLRPACLRQAWAESIEVGAALLVERDHLAVEHDAGQVEGAERLDELGKGVSADVTGAVAKHDVPSPYVREQAKPVELELVQPSLADERRPSRRRSHRVEVTRFDLPAHPAER
jgi:hypothetical protein